mmetsp:Transcript_4943/g.7354  ORF Transcript_4943/g.7354 Transcript_4943/m.7354 type:complete len:344 (-) Transcript_4943:2635-3666(-)
MLRKRIKVRSRQQRHILLPIGCLIIVLIIHFYTSLSMIHDDPFIPHPPTKDHHVKMFSPPPPPSPSSSSSTNTQHHPSSLHFHGKFTSIRSKLDYTYHDIYTKNRQLLQDDIIESYLSNQITTSLMIQDVEKDDVVCQIPKEPWIVFMAGAMGVGKSYTIKHLNKTKRFPLQSFIYIDPDEIRHYLPEYHHHLPEQVGYLTNKEAGYILEMITLLSLQSGYNTIIDGSLRDYKWYAKYFHFLRREYDTFRIAIIYVKAPSREAVFARAENRFKLTGGRIVPNQTLELALDQVPRSIEILKPLTDFSVEIMNPPNKNDVDLVNMVPGEDFSWDVFRKQWDQTCF